MKKTIAAIFAILIILFIGRICIKGYEKYSIRTKAELGIASMPKSIKFNTLEGKVFNFDSLEIGKNKIFIFFHTECEYCQHEIGEIISKQDSFKNVSIICISVEKKERIRQFKNQYNPKDIKLIKFLNDSSNAFFAQFGTNTIPATFLYNPEDKLIAQYKGEVSSETLIKKIR